MKNLRGFSLIELIVAIAVLGILALAGTTIASNAFTTVRVVDAGLLTSNSARYAVERLAREIREVQFVKGTGYTISSALTANATNLVFTGVDGSGADATVTINYSSGTKTLTLGYAGSTQTLAGQVSAFTLNFKQLNDDGTTTATTSVSSVRFVDISLTVADATSGQSVQERVRVALRNT